jgi:hypothetical protein
MFKANISCVAPTRIECPLTSFASIAVIPTNLATRLNVCAIESTCSRFPIRPRPINRRNTAPFLIPEARNHIFRYPTVSGDKYATLPSPTWSVFERRINTRPLPSLKKLKSSTSSATSSLVCCRGAAACLFGVKLPIGRPFSVLIRCTPKAIHRTADKSAFENGTFDIHCTPRPLWIKAEVATIAILLGALRRPFFFLKLCRARSCDQITLSAHQAGRLICFPDCAKPEVSPRASKNEFTAIRIANNDPPFTAARETSDASLPHRCRVGWRRDVAEVVLCGVVASFEDCLRFQHQILRGYPYPGFALVSVLVHVHVINSS